MQLYFHDREDVFSIKSGEVDLSDMESETEEPPMDDNKIKAAQSQKF